MLTYAQTSDLIEDQSESGMILGPPPTAAFLASAYVVLDENVG